MQDLDSVRIEQTPSWVRAYEIRWQQIAATIIIPSEYVGPVITLCSDHRGEQLEYTFIDSLRVFLKYRLPLREIVVDFYNGLKSITSGYASFDYEEAESLSLTLSLPLPP
ncbi:hypothetical protein POM88_006549 [Heracleum sosnowskyi]|uniref:Elongation factor EFG domain-containing protein n=1 Tax=Heracleum sosnowskyi TaxID=360622 RepID=A0AAD8J5N7_9APIA|nr:hypothetical protein POM88_006549 [Heracleum sosnowskyi]